MPVVFARECLQLNEYWQTEVTRGAEVSIHSNSRRFRQNWSKLFFNLTLQNSKRTWSGQYSNIYTVYSKVENIGVFNNDRTIHTLLLNRHRFFQKCKGKLEFSGIYCLFNKWNSGSSVIRRAVKVNRYFHAPISTRTVNWRFSVWS